MQTKVNTSPRTFLVPTSVTTELSRPPSPTPSTSSYFFVTFNPPTSIVCMPPTQPIVLHTFSARLHCNNLNLQHSIISTHLIPLTHICHLHFPCRFPHTTPSPPLPSVSFASNIHKCFPSQQLPQPSMAFTTHPTRCS